ncbi:tRNA 2'-phosphotransferase 1, partial [Kappamyces sp. JEL0829]
LDHRKFKAVDLAQLQEIVAADAKTRFTLRQDEHSDWWICANQGHSIQVAVEMDRIQDAAEIPVVVHGTNLAAWASIKNEGLSKMNRQHIHFAVGKLGEDGVKSGMRHNTAVFIYIDTALAMKDNIEFFRSANNVILSTGIAGAIPPLYFARVEDKMGNSLL